MMVASDSFRVARFSHGVVGGCRAEEHKSNAAYHSGLLLERVDED